MKEIENLTELGKRLRDSTKLQEKIKNAEVKNPWLVERFVQHAMGSIIREMLNEKKLKKWVSEYDLKVTDKTEGSFLREMFRWLAFMIFSFGLQFRRCR